MRNKTLAINYDMRAIVIRLLWMGSCCLAVVAEHMVHSHRIIAPEASKVLADGLSGIDPDRELVPSQVIVFEVVQERIVLLCTNCPVI
jgi:hypothetical protein